MFHVEQFGAGGLLRVEHSGLGWLGAGGCVKRSFLEVTHSAGHVFAWNYGCLCMGCKAAGKLCVLWYVPHARMAAQSVSVERRVWVWL